MKKIHVASSQFGYIQYEEKALKTKNIGLHNERDFTFLEEGVNYYAYLCCWSAIMEKFQNLIWETQIVGVWGQLCVWFLKLSDINLSGF